MPDELFARADLGALGRCRAIERHGQDAVSRRAAMLHAGDDFLADVAALLEAHAAQLVEIGLMREELAGAQVGLAVGKPQRDARRVIAFGRCRQPGVPMLRQPMPPERGSR